jgi:ABC-2 type transport system permease protein
MGKLIGAGAAGLTQLTIWMLSALALTAYSLTSASLYGLSFTFPNITVSIAIYFIIFFMLGFFIYATIFALIGSIVTTAQEGSQFAFIPIFLLIIAIYSIFPVLRNPNSTFAMWVSIAPFLAPIVMPVRILNETPPFWQIALSILLNLISIIGLVWAASKIYRIGMLMYGKRATIPEILKWIKY